MPAHSSPAAVGEAKLSNGSRLTHIDWRANRLADALAKRAASDGAPPTAVLRLLKSAQAAVEFSAKLLGRITFAANHHVVHAQTFPVFKEHIGRRGRTAEHVVSA